jgi:hypothetical protein
MRMNADETWTFICVTPQLCARLERLDFSWILFPFIELLLSQLCVSGGGDVFDIPSKIKVVIGVQ